MTRKPVPSILIVDDVPANLELLTKLLKNHGYKVRPAPSGKLALEAAKFSPPDLILLDIHMPDMDGFEVCQRLKADDTLKEIPVLFISALTKIQDKIEAFRHGGLDYIAKPFHVDEVLARVKTHLDLRYFRIELEKHNEMLQDTIRQLKITQSQLIQSEKMAALGVLSAGIAHEINNPVNFIKTSIHGLERDVEELLTFTNHCGSLCNEHLGKSISEEIERAKKNIEYETILEEIPALFKNIFEGIRRTEEIVKSLHTFARQDDYKIKATDIHEIVDSALVMLRNRYRNRIDIRKEYGYVPLISVNVGKLSQVMINVLSNAIDAIESKGGEDHRITICTEIRERNQREYAAVHISDTGIGIRDDIIHKLFDPFFTTKSVGKGTGLGLFITNNIITEHKGFIEVASEPRKGSTFSIFLPTDKEVVEC